MALAQEAVERVCDDVLSKLMAEMAEGRWATANWRLSLSKSFKSIGNFGLAYYCLGSGANFFENSDQKIDKMMGSALGALASVCRDWDWDGPMGREPRRRMAELMDFAEAVAAADPGPGSRPGHEKAKLLISSGSLARLRSLLESQEFDEGIGGPKKSSRRSLRT